MQSYFVQPIRMGSKAASRPRQRRAGFGKLTAGAKADAVDGVRSGCRVMALWGHGVVEWRIQVG